MTTRISTSPPYYASFTLNGQMIFGSKNLFEIGISPEANSADENYLEQFITILKNQFSFAVSLKDIQNTFSTHTETHRVVVNKTKVGYEFFIYVDESGANEAAALEKQLQDIEINKLEYRISVLDRVIQITSEFQSTQGLNYRFQEMISQQFLFSGSLLFKISGQQENPVDVVSAFPAEDFVPLQTLNTPGPNADLTTQIYDLLKTQRGLVAKDHCEKIQTLLKHFYPKDIQQLVVLPLIFENVVDSIFIFFTSPLHHSLTRSDLQLLDHINHIVTPLYRNASLLEIALTDELSKLGNRRMFNKVLDHEVFLAKQKGHALCLLIMDLDHFKRVNDTYGHDIGDEVIKTMGEVVRSQCNNKISGYRIGGEEFAMIIRGTKELAIATGEAVLAQRRSLKTEVDEKTSFVTTSSGGLTLYKAGDSGETLYKRADNALYKAKQGGRDRLHFD